MINSVTLQVGINSVTLQVGINSVTLQVGINSVTLQVGIKRDVLSDTSSWDQAGFATIRQSTLLSIDPSGTIKSSHQLDNEVDCLTHYQDSLRGCSFTASELQQIGPRLSVHQHCHRPTLCEEDPTMCCQRNRGGVQSPQWTSDATDWSGSTSTTCG